MTSGNGGARGAVTERTSTGASIFVWWGLQEIADDAIEGVQDLYKMNREDVKNLQHARNAEQAAKNKAGEWKCWLCMFLCLSGR